MFNSTETLSNYAGGLSPVKALDRFGDRVVLRDETGCVVRYGDVLNLGSTVVFKETGRRLVMCVVNNDLGGLAGYLALLVADSVPMMVSSTLSVSAVDALITAYQPDYLWLPQRYATRWPSTNHLINKGGYTLIGLHNDNSVLALHNDLALLLSTSGSTGSGKYVRLSHQNVWSNAAAIAKYLSLTAEEIPVTTLPPSYAYGLSIFHSHLCVGAGLAVTSKTLFDRDFWNFMREVKASSLSGVPYHYEILKKLRFTKMKLPHLRTLTQAGGSMSLELVKEFATHCLDNNMRFFAMYGQTEASPRMSYVPSERAVSKAGTIGIPISGGSLELRSDRGSLIVDNHVVGELVYRGPNVCLGYADGRVDLTLGDVNGGVLHTGDLAERDEDGYYRVAGRQSRFIKLFGNRINLQEVELQLTSSNLDVACSGRDDSLEVYVTARAASRALEIKQTLMSNLFVSAQGIEIYEVNELPRNESGKVRYADLRPDIARRRLA